MALREAVSDEIMDEHFICPSCMGDVVYNSGPYVFSPEPRFQCVNGHPIQIKV
jgi:hypothetical protein